MPPKLYDILCSVYPPACNGGGTGSGDKLMKAIALSVRDATDEQQAFLRANAFVRALAAEGKIDKALEMAQELQKLVPSDRFAQTSELYLIEADLQRQLGNSNAADLALSLSESLINSERLRLNLAHHR